MRILIVTATKPGSSRAPAEAFVRHVKEAFKKALRAHEKVEFIVRQHTELLEFLPPPPVPPAEADITASKYCIAAFDGLDFIFVDGDEQWLPWVPEVAPLLKLLTLAPTLALTLTLTLTLILARTLTLTATRSRHCSSCCT